MVKFQITIVESELQLIFFSLPLHHTTNLFPLYFETIQIFVQEWINELPSQAKLVVSNHHSKCLSKGKIIMMEICSKSDENPFYHQTLTDDLFSSLCKSTIWLFHLDLINAWITLWILEEK
jgi:hypothetical protein